MANMQADQKPTKAVLTFEQVRMLEDERDWIAVATLYPIPGNCSWFAWELLTRALAADFNRSGIQAEKFGGMAAQWFILCGFRVHARNEALRAVVKALNAMDLLSLSEVAYYDRAESIWRSIHPKPAAPFDRFFADENIAFSRAQAEMNQRNASQ
jgi:hypothetical protein